MAAIKRADLNHVRVAEEPNWLTGDLGKYPEADFFKLTTAFRTSGGSQLQVTGPLQQSDLLRPLLMDIARHGLAYAYNKYTRVHGIRSDATDGPVQQTNNPKHVIIVGAGMAGLVAAHELVRVGHKVTIVETQDRVGGRVKTISHDGGAETKTHKQRGEFAPKLYCEAGAMRLPCRPEKPAEEMTHFLTAFYGERFQLIKLPFVNFDENAFLKFYNAENIKIAAWNATPESRERYTSRFWPGWDDRIKSTGAKDKYNIVDIDEYYNETTNIVVEQLRLRLAGVISRSKQAAIWDSWIATWSQFSLWSFLTSTLDGVVARIPQDCNSPQLNMLGYLLPWPQAAITAYTQFNYTEQLDQCLVQYLRDQMGEWWSPHMHRYKNGMSQLPLKFEEANGLADKPHRWEIVKNCTINNIKYDSPAGNMHNEVTVSGYKHGPGDHLAPKMYEDVSYTGAAVIVTTPVHILRQIKFEPVSDSLPLPNEFYNAISDIWYGPSTKIMLQCKTRFWESEKYDIRGGFSKTTLPIGQLHYPSNPKGADPPVFPDDVKGGILLIYTWKSEALMFGALDPNKAVAEAVRQITEIHPEMKTEYDDVWAIEPWYDEPSAQGAYCLLKPSQFRNVTWLTYPWRNLYFAGEAISFASGWIQGALESGLRAAYQFYSRNENEARAKK